MEIKKKRWRKRDYEELGGEVGSEERQTKCLRKDEDRTSKGECG